MCTFRNHMVKVKPDTEITDTWDMSHCDPHIHVYFHSFMQCLIYSWMLSNVHQLRRHRGNPDLYISCIISTSRKVFQSFLYKTRSCILDSLNQTTSSAVIINFLCDHQIWWLLQHFIIFQFGSPCVQFTVIQIKPIYYHAIILKFIMSIVEAYIQLMTHSNFLNA